MPVQIEHEEEFCLFRLSELSRITLFFFTLAQFKKGFKELNASHLTLFNFEMSRPRYIFYDKFDNGVIRSSKISFSCIFLCFRHSNIQSISNPLQFSCVNACKDLIPELIPAQMKCIYILQKSATSGSRC